MVITMNTQFTASLQQLSAVGNQTIAGRSIGQRLKGTLYLISIGFNNQACILNIILFAVIQHLRPPKTAIKIRGIIACFLIYSVKISFWYRRWKIIYIEQLYIYHRINIILIQLTKNGCICTIIILVVSLPTIADNIFSLTAIMTPDNRMSILRCNLWYCIPCQLYICHPSHIASRIKAIALQSQEHISRHTNTRHRNFLPDRSYA